MTCQVSCNLANIYIYIYYPYPYSGQVFAGIILYPFIGNLDRDILSFAKSCGVFVWWDSPCFSRQHDEFYHFSVLLNTLVRH